MDARSRFQVEPNVQTHFAWLRTRLSAERTLMSWVRTGAALIGFNYLPAMTWARWTPWALWTVALVTVFVTLYCVVVWTRGVEE